MRARMLILMVVLAVPASAFGQASQFGSPLTAEPNFFGCDMGPTFADQNGNMAIVPSGQPDCTWRQGGVFGSTTDPRGSTVPADGRIIQAEVKSGPNPAPLKFQIIRQIESVCCYFQNETAPIALTPNAVTTVPLDLKVERNTIGGVIVYDFVAVAANSGTGTLPVFSNGHNNALANQTEPGNPIAGFWYPRLGGLSGDGTPGGGRRESGYPGAELLVRWTFCPAGQTCGSTGGNQPIGDPASIVPALFSKNLRLKNNRALIKLVCHGSAVCEGNLDLVNQGAVPAATKVTKYGSKKYRIAPNATNTIKLKINRKAKKLFKKKKKVKLGLKITPVTGTPTTARITLKR